jgi:hypothetical protein
MPSQGGDSGVDASVGVDASLDAGMDTAPTEFDVGITYVDRPLPDVSAPSEAGAGMGDAAAVKEGGLVPCTTAGQMGCVSCPGNAFSDGGGVCSPTEALFVQHDIDLGVATEAGADPMGSCYQCLLKKLALDDLIGDMGNECHDPLTTKGSTEAQCMATISCILGSGNGMPASSCAGLIVNNCYCGPAAPGNACQMAGSNVNGVCAMQIAAGLGFPVSDNADILKNFADQSRAAGIATTLFETAVADHCDTCLR